MPFNLINDLGYLAGQAVANLITNTIFNAENSISGYSEPSTVDKYNTVKENEKEAAAVEAKATTSSFVNVDAEKAPDFDQYVKENNIRYGRSFADFEDLVGNFNLSRLPNYDMVPMPYIGHIIFSRPNLYVDITPGMNTGNSDIGNPDPRANFDAMKNHPALSAFVNDKYGQALLNMMSYKNTSNYMPIFTTQAKSYTVGDVGIETIKSGEVFYGHSIKYGHYSESHKLGGTISIEFRNDYYYSILKTVYIWMKYIDIVSRTSNVIVPSLVSQLNGILDYCGSIYYLVTDASMSKLIYWEKLVGVYPTNAPFSIFSYNDAPAINDSITIEFDYAMKSEPCDPNVLFDLDMLSGGSYQIASRYMQYGTAYQYQVKSIDYSDRNTKRYWSKAQRPDSFSGPFALGDAFAQKPIIQSVQTGQTLNYYLHWLK